MVTSVSAWKLRFHRRIQCARYGHLGVVRVQRETFVDLKSVRETYRCSSGLVHRVLYEQLELKRPMRLYPWPTKASTSICSSMISSSNSVAS